jgi:hypothetical protein
LAINQVKGNVADLTELKSVSKSGWQSFSEKLVDQVIANILVHSGFK